MNLKPARVALLSLSVALAVAACGKSGDQANTTATAPADGAAAQAPAADNPNAAQISGAGSSFVYPLVSRWSADYAGISGNKVNYQSIGSGGGIAQIKAGTVDFGASDKPLTPEELAEANLAQFPVAIGGVVPVVNLEGVDAGKLRLTGPLLADIFLGKVTQWNDPAIVAANPDLKLPDTKISLVHRSDGSGTSYNFTNYLSKVSPEWKDKIGEGTSVQWPGGVGGKGNEGVASYVKQIKGGIGYVELAYALQSAMPYTAMQNAAGQWVQPNAETFAAAAESAEWANAKDFDLVITNAPGEQAWPITATTFVLMRKQGDAKHNADALAFFKWAFANGQKQADELHYVPLPQPLVDQISTYWGTAFK
ncbi:phosphate ABC transporter substrate-binding protein PstS [Pseudoxanthomonas sp. JBR18]|uniref:phosphate ABC transporter substrate-binding protein PstS n=1 Tax=Pseudoxanthomonas sp. JBR18 TaxID=2969308 RepID=UPI002306843E|nr:phosphate ABC transporter substrate-binding protein PstS [Pseudoxanthomonas sp. JBR18]WCE04235.1 phosphate ABC transporter substrate-binding protein PstS [Pseudoxanthomonas sp. JBR18]